MYNNRILSFLIVLAVGFFPLIAQHDSQKAEENQEPHQESSAPDEKKTFDPGTFILVSRDGFL